MTLTEDTLFLYNSINLNEKIKKIIEIGCGNGMLLKEHALLFPDIDFYGIDIQTEKYEQNNLHILRADLKEIKEYFSPHYFDLLISNPPYFGEKEGKISPNNKRKSERHGHNFSIELLLEMIKYLVKPNGLFYFLYPANNLFKVLKLAEINNLKIYSIRFRHTKKNKEADICLFYGKNRSGKIKPHIKYPLLKGV